MATVTPAAAQTIQGVVIDELSGRAVPSVAVLLFDTDGKLRAGRVSDSTGAYTITAPLPGKYSVRVERDGYAALSTPPIELAASDNIELELRLSRKATELDPVTVTGKAERPAPGPLADFYRRKERGIGAFVTREDIEARGVPDFTDVLRNVGHHVRIVSMPAGVSQVFTVRFSGTGGAQEICPPVVYYDGFKLGSIDEINPDQFFITSDIEGIEAYARLSVPPEFQDRDSGCGVVVVWSKRGP
ncbi:MAG: carboxypeptidase regulatory-like domain-containing protein [Gemmatimonadales bacterium]